MKNILITGSSTGIGRSTAVSLAKQGFQVFAGVRNEKVGKELEKEAGANLKAILIDVCDELSIEKAKQTLERQVQSLDALINNAGIAIAGPLEMVPVKDLRQQLDVNVIGLVATTQAFLPILRKARGRIINIGSISGKVTSPFLGAYAASKYAVEAVSDAFRRELVNQGIQVSLIEPGPIQTPIWDKSSKKAYTIRDSSKPHLLEIYQKDMDVFEKAVMETAKGALPPEKVTEAIVHALTAERANSRYVIGGEAKMASVMSRLLPDRAMDYLLSKQMVRYKKKSVDPKS